jgi:hypothetical protein
MGRKLRGMPDMSTLNRLVATTKSFDKNKPFLDSADI